MRITVNGQEKEVAEGASVEDLVREAGLSERACAVEINRELVPKASRSDRELQEGDAVELVTLIGGG